MTHIWCQKWGSEDTTRHPLLTASDSLQNRGRDFPSMVQPFPGSPVPIPSQPPTGGCGDMLIRQNTPNVQPPQDKSGERIVSSIGAKKLILAGLHDLKSSSLSTVSVNHIILQSRVQSFLFNYPPPFQTGPLGACREKEQTPWQELPPSLLEENQCNRCPSKDSIKFLAKGPCSLQFLSRERR